MSGASLQFKRSEGVDRFYGADRARRTQHYVPRVAAVSPPSTSGKPDGRTEATTMKASPEAVDRRASLPGNLDRFLEATTPSVPAQYLSKTMRGWRTCYEECRTYFKLEDLWESFKEWSAYGTGVPLVLNGRDSVVQYYVPYLSGIQLYADSRTQSFAPSDPMGDSDVDSFQDSSSDGSSDAEMESGSKCSSICCEMNKPSFDDRHISLQDDFSSDDSDCGDSLIFEYLEYDRPYCREPLANKIAVLAEQFPVLKTIKSCDLLPTSWFSVAWYPIYRIPTGPTLRDLDACFLTFHCLSTPMKGSVCGASISKRCGGVNDVPKMCLPVFGLASYKFKSSIWTCNSGGEGKLANSLLEAADKWLRLLKANLPDYRFFASQYTFRR